MTLSMTRSSALGSLLAAALAVTVAAPAQATDAAGRWAQASKALTAEGGPTTLTDQQRKLYADVLAAMKAKRWADADALLDSDKDGPLAHYLRAQLLLAPDSPRAELAAAGDAPRVHGIETRRYRAAPPARRTAADLGRQRAAPHHRALG
jgi:hypothetical protein